MDEPRQHLSMARKPAAELLKPGIPCSVAGTLGRHGVDDGRRRPVPAQVCQVGCASASVEECLKPIAVAVACRGGASTTRIGRGTHGYPPERQGMSPGGLRGRASVAPGAAAGDPEPCSADLRPARPLSRLRRSHSRDDGRALLGVRSQRTRGKPRWNGAGSARPIGASGEGGGVQRSEPGGERCGLRTYPGEYVPIHPRPFRQVSNEAGGGRHRNIEATITFGCGRSRWFRLG
jgi:hypothetical protein